MAAGVLSLVLECAYGLKNMDYLTKQDPYCILQCGQVKLLSSTHFSKQEASSSQQCCQQY